MMQLQLENLFSLIPTARAEPVMLKLINTPVCKNLAQVQFHSGPEEQIPT